ncbi:EamA family transporter [bacterium CG17_big_fil_post_rev_8_21_14_2_50_64_8]|nr:MAG: EamA family transporter [bacterium CG17_big_fil_post_rev_8_21_14_2_50_64_8]PJA74304.1 MAG: EamA family transporter [bacterium CG_4_9_14_3_um_filter_65_15]
MVYLLAASVLWAFSFGLIKAYLADLDPVLVAAVRLVLAAAVFAPFLVRARLRGRLVPMALGLGGLQFGAMYVLYIMSFRWLPAWLVAMLTIFTPLYVIILADFRQRSFRVRHLLAALLAVAGAAVVMSRGLPAGADWRGVLALQGANVCFAVGQVFYPDLKMRSGGHDLGLMAWLYQGAALVAVAATLATRSSTVGWTGQSVLVLLYLGLVPTAAGFYLWNKGAVLVGRGRLAVANNLKIPLAVLVAWSVFGESAPYGRALAGLALLVAGLWVAVPPVGKRG